MPCGKVFRHPALSEYHGPFSDPHITAYPDLSPKYDIVFHHHTTRQPYLGSEKAIAAYEGIVSYVHMVVEFGSGPNAGVGTYAAVHRAQGPYFDIIFENHVAARIHFFAARRSALVVECICTEYSIGMNDYAVTYLGSVTHHNPGVNNTIIANGDVMPDDRRGMNMATLSDDCLPCFRRCKWKRWTKMTGQPVVHRKGIIGKQ